MAESVEIVDKRPDRSNPKEYGDFECLLDRVLIRKLPQDTGGGLETPAKYREPQSWGEVINIGDSVVLGGVKWPLSDYVNVGDIVKFGEHTAEQFDTNDEDVFIVRIQDLRGRRRWLNRS